MPEFWTQLDLDYLRGWKLSDWKDNEWLVAGACNHPNLLVLPFSLKLIRAAA